MKSKATRTKVPPIVLRALLLTMTALALIACRTENSPQNTTDFKLNWIHDILQECGVPPGKEDMAKMCLDAYFNRGEHNVGNSSPVLIDGYGRELRLAPADHCAITPNCAPYSLGANGIDECGLGDDLSRTPGCGR